MVGELGTFSITVNEPIREVPSPKCPTLAVTICPSRSTLSMVAVGKYGRMIRKDLMRYLPSHTQR